MKFKEKLHEAAFFFQRKEARTSGAEWKVSLTEQVLVIGSVNRLVQKDPSQYPVQDDNNVKTLNRLHDDGQTLLSSAAPQPDHDQELPQRADCTGIPQNLQLHRRHINTLTIDVQTKEKKLAS